MQNRDRGYTGPRLESEQRGTDEVPPPSLDDAFTVDQLKQEYPEWEKHYSGDAELTALSYERTRFLRDIGQKLSQPRTMLGGEGLRWAMKETSVELGSLFDSHGIAGKQDAVMELDTLLNNGIDKSRSFYSMGFMDVGGAGAAFGADHPFTQGGFVIVGECGKPLVDSGPRYVVVGEEYGRVLGILQNRYPNIEFIPWHLAPSRFAEVATQKTGEQYTAPILNDANRPYYDISVESTTPAKSTMKVAEVEKETDLNTKEDSEDDWSF